MLRSWKQRWRMTSLECHPDPACSVSLGVDLGPGNSQCPLSFLHLFCPQTRGFLSDQCEIPVVPQSYCSFHPSSPQNPAGRQILLTRASRTIIRSRNDSPFGEKCSYTYVRVQSTEIISSVGAYEINKCIQWWEEHCIGKWKKNKRLTSNDMLAFPRYTLWQFTQGHVCCLLSPGCNKLADSLWWEARYNSCWLLCI